MLVRRNLWSLMEKTLQLKSTAVKSVSCRPLHQGPPLYSDVQLEANHLQIKGAADPVMVNYAWLRDHCKCPNCLHPVTGQKMTDCRSFNINIQPKKVDLEANQLKVEWLDGHNSVFDAAQLASNFIVKDNKGVQPVFWKRKDIRESQVEKIPFNKYMNCEGSRRKLLKNILKYGFGFVKGAPAAGEIMEQSMERLGPLMVTHLGRLETIGTGIKHSDVSYGKAFLPIHTDHPYMNDPPGITFLQCSERKCQGGETIIVDGFRIAQDLKREDPQAYEILASGVRRFEHTRPGKHYTNNCPVINLDPGNGELKLIRYGTFYMQELQVDQTLAQKYYEAMVKFDEKVYSPEYQFPFVLEEGDQVYFNNWRMIHGRNGFSGTRVLTTQFMKMDDLKSISRLAEFL